MICGTMLKRRPRFTCYKCVGYEDDFNETAWRIHKSYLDEIIPLSIFGPIDNFCGTTDIEGITVKLIFNEKMSERDIHKMFDLHRGNKTTPIIIGKKYPKFFDIYVDGDEINETNDNMTEIYTTPFRSNSTTLNHITKLLRKGKELVPYHPQYFPKGIEEKEWYNIPL